MKESDLQRAVGEYLKYQMNLGKLWFTRLNSGMAYKKHGNKYYAIKLCEKGTADFIVIQATGKEETFVTFIELKSDTGKQTKEQKEFQETVVDQQADYLIIRDLEELEGVL